MQRRDMPTDSTDIAQDALYNATTATQENVARHLRRLKRYPGFIGRLRTRQRIGGLINRVLTVGLVDWGVLLAIVAAAWGAVTRRRRRP